MPTRRYRVHYVHKIQSTACRCGHAKYHHHHDLHALEGSLWGHGPCTAKCECVDYEPDESDDVAADLPVETVESDDVRAIATMLRTHRLIGPRTRLDHVRHAVDCLLCFPHGGTTHCVVVEPWVDRPDDRDVVTSETTHRIYRIRWTRMGRCYVTSVANGALLGSYHDGWGSSGGLPDDVRDAAMAHRPTS